MIFSQSEANKKEHFLFLFFFSTAPISAKTVGTVIGVLVALAVVIGIAAFVYYKFFHQKRVRERAQRQMAVAHTSAQPQQVTIHPPPAGPQASYAPPPYDQGTGAPYPPQGRLIGTVCHLIVKVLQRKSSLDREERILRS